MALNAAHLQSPDLDRDELARFARPAKRVHLETPEDRHTYGKLAGLQIDAFPASAPNQYSFGDDQQDHEPTLVWRERSGSARP